MINESTVPGAQPVMPNTCGDVRTDVGIKFWFFDNSAWKVIVEPPAIGMLNINEPLVSPLCIVMETCDI